MKEITEVRLIVDSVIQLWGSFFLGGTGVVSNALNIAVFWRLGFRETANISLMLIAVIDCVKCSVSFLYRGYGLAGLFDVVLEVNWTRVTYLLNAHVQNLGVPMVSVVTMYVTVERCVCMCLPLKVKSILTTKVTAISLISLITLSGATISPICMMYYVTWFYDPIFNQTVAQYMPTDYFIRNIHIVDYINVIYMCWNSTAFVVIAICTVIIIVKLQKHATFRSEHFSNSTLKNLSTNTVAVADKEKSIARCDRESNVSSSHEDTSIEHTSAHPRQSKIFKVRRRFQGGRGSTLKTRQSDVHLSKKESRLVKMLLLIILVYCINILPRQNSIRPVGIITCI
uniref:G-protein coupled receptors family 1 profile domain-containing protein n=1 Tax=Biomphalaria glabrata TaxID=6526 RepID=A0A2C9KXD3_BIOGL